MRHSKPVRLETAPTGPDKSGSKPRGENVYLFLEFTINQQLSIKTLEGIRKAFDLTEDEFYQT